MQGQFYFNPCPRRMVNKLRYQRDYENLAVDCRYDLPYNNVYISIYFSIKLCKVFYVFTIHRIELNYKEK